jgi:hypothetical protein
MVGNFHQQKDKIKTEGKSCKMTHAGNVWAKCQGHLGVLFFEMLGVYWAYSLGN